MSATRGGIILCGGRSSRMGADKALLPFGPETMLQRVVRLLGEVCRPLVVVAAKDQRLPNLAADVIVARDRRPAHGPLEGLAVGMAALGPNVATTFAISCDAPLVAPAFAERMFELLEDHAAAVPACRGQIHPLAAVYRTSVLEVIEEMLSAGVLRAAQLFDIINTRRVHENRLTDVDPQLGSLRNVNQPWEYVEALTAAGFEAPPEVLALLLPKAE